VLGPTEHCVLYDQDGMPKTHGGPGRVFPGPYDTIRYGGSRNGVYDDYHIRTDRGILLRIVAKEVSQVELLKRLPLGIKLEKESYAKGDEIFVGEIDAYLVPHSFFEVIHPVTRKPHVGNDHEGIYVEAIGVDQKSGVYVETVDTGDIKLEKGETKLLLDPRTRKHVKRRVPGWLWNLMIGHNEPHKKVNPDSYVETPWALSVQVPNNEAVLVISKSGRRPVVGPCTELLEYDEVLEVLKLSRGKEKSDKDQLETCFLRVTGNRISDRITLETANKIKVRVDVEYGVTFVGDEPCDQEKWFNYIDYVMLLCTNCRSRLMAAARAVSLMELDKVLSDFVRETILGDKEPAGEDGESHRPGLFFEVENNMKIEEVEVKDYEILDPYIADALANTNRSVVTRLVEDAEKRSVLESERIREEIADAQRELKVEAEKKLKAMQDELDTLAIANAKRDADTAKEKADAAHETALHNLGLEHEASQEQQKNYWDEMAETQKRKDEEALLTRKRKSKNHALELGLAKSRRKALVDFRASLAEIQKAMIASEGKVDVERLNAIQPQLIKAIEGLGDNVFLSELAKGLPQAAGSGFNFLMEGGGIAALKHMLKNTKFERKFDALGVSEGELVDGVRRDETSPDNEDREFSHDGE